MAVDRRKFLLTTGLSVAGSALAKTAPATPEPARGLADWDQVRGSRVLGALALNKGGGDMRSWVKDADSPRN